MPASVWPKVPGLKDAPPHLATICFCCCFVCFETGFLCITTLAVDQADLKLTKIHLPLPPKCWDYNVYKCFTFVYACTLYVCCALRGQKRTLDPLELELQAVMNYQVSVRN